MALAIQTVPSGHELSANADSPSEHHEHVAPPHPNTVSLIQKKNNYKHITDNKFGERQISLAENY